MSEFDPIGRELCPDGSCIGVIGPDRSCRECGRLSERPLDPRLRGLKPGEQAAPDDLSQLGRDLCSDGGCVGVLGIDGRCHECGLSAQSATAAAESIEASAPGEAEEPDGSADNSEDNPDFGDRELCPDGACIGLLGRDRRCQECGAAAPS